MERLTIQLFFFNTNPHLIPIMKRIVFHFSFFFVCLLGFMASASAQTTPVAYCPAVDTNAIIVTLDNATPCNTSFAWRANGWQGYYNVYLSTTPEITATGTVATLLTNSTTVTLGDFGPNVAQYGTAYYVIVQLQNAQDGQPILAPAHKTIIPVIIAGGSGSVNCSASGIITNVIMTRVISNSPSSGTVCPNGLTYNTVLSTGLTSGNTPPLVLSSSVRISGIPITWIGGGGGVDAAHPAFMTWDELQIHLLGKLSAATPQYINLKSDTPIGGGALCQPCISTPGSFSTLNSLTKEVPRAGYSKSGNTLNPSTVVVNLNNCVEVKATLQW
jgi:hypothetical protein